MANAQDVTPTQFAALMAKITKDIAPAEPPTKTVQQRLMAYRQTLLAYRRRGYTVPQLVEFVKHPDINIPTSPVTLRKVLAGEGKKKARTPGDSTLTVLPATPPPTP